MSALCGLTDEERNELLRLILKAAGGGSPPRRQYLQIQVLLPPYGQPAVHIWEMHKRAADTDDTSER